MVVATVALLLGAGPPASGGGGAARCTPAGGAEVFTALFSGAPAKPPPGSGRWIKPSGGASTWKPGHANVDENLRNGAGGHGWGAPSWG